MEFNIKIEVEEYEDKIGLPDQIKKDTKHHINESVQNQRTNNEAKVSKADCFQCKICPYNTLRQPYLEKHMMQKHGFSKVNVEKKHESLTCSKVMNIDIISNTDIKSEEILHQEIHEDKRKEAYKCMKCEFQTEEVSALRDHETSHKKLILFNCSKCDYATRQKCNLKAHMRVHEDTKKLKKFTCATCQKFVSLHYSALLRHIRLKHGNNGIIFKCDKCHFSTKIKIHLTDHYKTHAGHDDAPMFKCEKCGFITHNERTIKMHVRRHETRQEDGEEVILKKQGGEREIVWFCCNLCDFRSNDQRYVILHKKVHTRVDEINRVVQSALQSVDKEKPIKSTTKKIS